MATAYYTDAYMANVPPDGNVPAGTKLAQFTTFVGKTSNHTAGDTFYMLRIPKNAVLCDVIVQWPLTTSGTLDVGTSTAHNSIFADISMAAAGRASFKGGFQGTSALNTELLQSSVTVGTKFTSADYIYFTVNTGLMLADAVLRCAIIYFIDHGSDMAYDPG
jgi:hypothetical protein